MAQMTVDELDELAAKKVELLKDFLKMEPPEGKGDSLLLLWRKIYDDIKDTVVETTSGPSDDKANRVFPYEKIRAIVGDGGNWKWPRMWQKYDDIERRGAAYRQGEAINFEQPNKNPDVVPMRVLVVGGGPIGLRMSIELALGGHHVTTVEKRREIVDEKGSLKQLGFTNRINRPHMWPYVRNDLGKLNGRDLLSRQAAYPVFTEPETSSIGIDEIQVLLLKSVFMFGVDFRLGVGYEDAKININSKTCKPTWDVELTYDEEAAAYYNMPVGKNVCNYDILIGCDGPRTFVRSTQQKHFGEVSKRKFMDCVGIVANVQKLPRKRLTELGFPHGQEPSDMNRTKMVFKPFFAKINEEAGADLESLIYYKASFHNYTILTPKKESLIANGLSGKVYSFGEGRAAIAQEEEKKKLRAYCKKVLVAAGVPIDPELPNEGFVKAPNDCMAFDFAECWNTKKSMNFNYPPEDYDVSEHGPWVGGALVPMVALAGDALLEPFWPLGLGLKRGWQAIMDTCYVVDNIYNRTLLCDKLGKDPDEFSWDDHYEALREQAGQNFENCNRVQVGADLGKGEYATDGMVITQWKKNAKEADCPEFLVEIDPNTRYANPDKEQTAKYKRMALDDPKWLHPIVRKNLAMQAYREEVKKRGDKSSMHLYADKKLVSINGKTMAPPPQSGYKFKAPGKKEKPEPAAAPRMSIPTAEVASRSETKRQSLHRTITAEQIDAHVTKKPVGAVAAMPGMPGGFMAALAKRQADAADDGDHEERKAQLMDHSHDVAETGLTAHSEHMWDRMTEQGLTPSQTAELAHVRAQIKALTESLEAYRQAEMKLLKATRTK